MDTFVFVCTCYSVTTKESKKDIISATALVIYVMKGKEHHIVSLRKNIENLLQKHLVSYRGVTEAKLNFASELSVKLD